MWPPGLEEEEVANGHKGDKGDRKKIPPEQIEGCITQQIETGKNICVEDSETEKIINDLSKASFVRERMEKV